MEEARDGVGDVEHVTHHGYHKECVDHGWDPGQQGRVEDGDGAGRGWRHEDLKQLLQVSNFVAFMTWVLQMRLPAMRFSVTVPMTAKPPVAHELSCFDWDIMEAQDISFN